MHRTYFKILYPGQSSGEYDPNGKDIHSRSCKISATKIANIVRIYRNNFTNVGPPPDIGDEVLILVSKRTMPVSAVHPVFTAAIIHLLDVKTAGAEAQGKTMQHLFTCIKGLYEMNLNWDWANRSVRAIQSLAAQWEVDIWAAGLEDHLSEEHRHQFEKYELSCLAPGTLPPSDSGQNYHKEAFLGETSVEFFDAWTHEYSFMDAGFNLFDDE